MSPHDFSDDTWQLLERYCAGEATSDDRRALHQELGTTPISHPVVQGVRRATAQAAVSDRAFTERAVLHLWAQIAEQDPESAAMWREGEARHQAMGYIEDDRNSSSRAARSVGLAFLPRPSRVTRYASTHATSLAVAGLSIVAAGLFAVRHVTTPSRSAAMVTYVTQDAQRRNIDLPDGTRVSLNVASQLSVPSGFDAAHRTVHLRGEAFFSVKHAEGKVFSVEAANRVARVLGTEFSVRAYDSADVRVAVRTGRVAFDQTVLKQNDVARARGKVLVVEQDQPVDDLVGFTRGRLVLNNMPLRDAIPEINRWYGTRMRLNDASLGDVAIRMTGSTVAGSDLITRIAAAATSADSATRVLVASSLRAPLDGSVAVSQTKPLTVRHLPRDLKLSPQEVQHLLQGAAQRERAQPSVKPRPTDDVLPGGAR